MPPQPDGPARAHPGTDVDVDADAACTTYSARAEFAACSPVGLVMPSLMQYIPTQSGPRPPPGAPTPARTHRAGTCPHARCRAKSTPTLVAPTTTATSPSTCPRRESSMHRHPQTVQQGREQPEHHGRQGGPPTSHTCHPDRTNGRTYPRAKHQPHKERCDWFLCKSHLRPHLPTSRKGARYLPWNSGPLPLSQFDKAASNDRFAALRGPIHRAVQHMSIKGPLIGTIVPLLEDMAMLTMNWAWDS